MSNYVKLFLHASHTFSYLLLCPSTAFLPSSHPSLSRRTPRVPENLSARAAARTHNSIFLSLYLCYVSKRLKSVFSLIEVVVLLYEAYVPSKSVESVLWVKGRSYRWRNSNASYPVWRFLEIAITTGSHSYPSLQHWKLHFTKLWCGRCSARTLRRTSTREYFFFPM